MSAFTEKLIVTMIVVTAVLGVFRGAKEMGIIAGVFIAALFFANLDRFTKFKGAGIEAELRTVVDKAYAAIDQLKELGLSLSAPVVDSLAMSGKLLQYIPLKYKLERVEKIRENLKKLGASDQEIEEACSTIYQRVTSDHLRRVLYNLKNGNPEKGSLFVGLDDGKMDDMDATKLATFIVENKLTKNAETEELIQDLEFFQKNRKLRREEKWQS